MVQNKNKNKKKTKKRPSARVYLGERELGALKFLANFNQFKDNKPADVLKSCLFIVAIDAKYKLDEAQKEYEEANNAADGSGTNDELPGADAGGEDNSGAGEADREETEETE